MAPKTPKPPKPQKLPPQAAAPTRADARGSSEGYRSPPSLINTRPQGQTRKAHTQGQTLVGGSS